MADDQQLFAALRYWQLFWRGNKQAWNVGVLYKATPSPPKLRIC